MTHQYRIAKIRKDAEAKGLGLGRYTEFLESVATFNVLSPDQLKKLDEIERKIQVAK